MNCFYHYESPAVGVCRSCGKGVCRDCAAEVKNGIACRDMCEERVELLNAIVDNNSRVVKVAKLQSRRAGRALLFFGAAFGAAGVALLPQSIVLGGIMTALGAMYGYFGYSRIKEQKALKVPGEEAHRAMASFPLPPRSLDDDPQTS